MVDTAPETQEAPHKGMPGWLTTGFKAAALAIPGLQGFAAMSFGQDIVNGTKSFMLAHSAHPAEAVFNHISKEKELKTEEGQAALAGITGDKEFMGALDKALKTDSTLRSMLLEGGNSSGGMNAQDLVTALKDDHTREVFTQVLKVAGANPNDELDGKWIGQITEAAHNQQWGKLNTLLGKGGIHDNQVAMGAEMETNPIGGFMKMMGEFSKNPNASIKDWINNPIFKDLGPEGKSWIAMLGKMFAGLVHAFQPGQGFIDPYLDFAKGPLADARHNALAEVENSGGGTVGDKSNVSAPSARTAFNQARLPDVASREPDAIPEGQSAPRVDRVDNGPMRGVSFGGASLG